MPYPRNVQTAMLVEKTVRDNGAVPATIGIIDGEITIGMTPEEIEVFGKRKGIAKVSKRDLPIIVAKKLWGATTVSATMTRVKTLHPDWTLDSIEILKSPEKPETSEQAEKPEEPKKPDDPNSSAH